MYNAHINYPFVFNRKLLSSKAEDREESSSVQPLPSPWGELNRKQRLRLGGGGEAAVVPSTHFTTACTNGWSERSHSAPAALARPQTHPPLPSEGVRRKTARTRKEDNEHRQRSGLVIRNCSESHSRAPSSAGLPRMQLLGALPWLIPKAFCFCRHS